MKRPKYVNRPFTRLPLKQRACFILHLAGFTHRQIKLLLGTGSDYTSQAITMGCKEYANKVGTKHTIVRGGEDSTEPKEYQRDMLMRYPNGVEYVADLIESRKWTTGGGKRAKRFNGEE